METRHINLKRHTKPDRHRRRYDPPFWRWVLEFLLVAAVLVLVIAAAEAVCTALGCPVDPWALR